MVNPTIFGAIMMRQDVDLSHLRKKTPNNAREIHLDYNRAETSRDIPTFIHHSMQQLDQLSFSKHSLTTRTITKSRIERLHHPRKVISQGNPFRHTNTRRGMKKWSSSVSPIKLRPHHETTKSISEKQTFLHHEQDTITFCSNINLESDVLIRIFCYLTQNDLYHNVVKTCKSFHKLINDPAGLPSLSAISIRLGANPKPDIVSAITTRIFHCPWQDIKLNFYCLPEPIVSWLPSIAERIISIKSMDSSQSHSRLVQEDIINVLGSEKMKRLSRIQELQLATIDRRILVHLTNLRKLHTTQLDKIPIIEEVLEGESNLYIPFIESLVELSIISIKTDEALHRLCSKFPSLEYLGINLDYDSVVDISSISMLTNLTSLHVNYNSDQNDTFLYMISKAACVVNLTIDFEGSEKADISSIKLPHKLRSLTLKNNRTKNATLPSLAAIKDTLVDLRIYNCEFSSIHYSNASLHNLIELHWESNVSPKNMEVLLYNNKIRLVRLKCHIQMIPFDGHRCSYITKLVLSDCHFKYLPNSICGLRCITALNILNNNNFKLSFNIGLLTSLYKLRITGSGDGEKNIMTEVPSSISKLTKLRILAIRDTSISTIPSIENLLSLKYIDLSHNNISRIPNEFLSEGRFPNLEVLLLDGNPIKNALCNVSHQPNLCYVSSDYQLLPSTLDLGQNNIDQIVSKVCSYISTTLEHQILLNSRPLRVTVCNVVRMKYFLQVNYILEFERQDQGFSYLFGRLVLDFNLMPSTTVFDKKSFNTKTAFLMDEEKDFKTLCDLLHAELVDGVVTSGSSWTNIKVGSSEQIK